MRTRLQHKQQVKPLSVQSILLCSFPVPSTSCHVLCWWWREKLLQVCAAVVLHTGAPKGRKLQGGSVQQEGHSTGFLLTSRLMLGKGTGENRMFSRHLLKVTFPLTGSTPFYLLVIKKSKKQELFIASFFHRRGEMAEEFLVVSCLFTAIFCTRKSCKM